MNKHFDMDSIFSLLIDDTISTRAYVKGHSMHDPRRQRSLIFAFHYHTLVGKGRSPLHFQNHDPDVNEKDDHIPLSTCSSIVALSLAGGPIKTYRRHSRRAKVLESNVHDPFAPWHVLSIQAFPDWQSEVNLHETSHHYVNGPDAFLTTLIHEYRDAVKRFRSLTTRIGRLSTPLKEIIFNGTMRDNLLFETGDFVWSRRYFWAAQTLAILSDEMDAMIDAYKDTFTDEVWAGEHKTIFPGTADTSARYANWRKKMFHQRKLLEREVDNLKEIRRFCEREQKDIKGLREWLFSGTSVQESRKAVEQASITVDQGYNIKLLTLVTIFFLPLTFCTSVYGMSTINEEEGFTKFGGVVIAICLPTYLLILVINYRTFQKTVAKCAWPVVWTVAKYRMGMGWAQRYNDKYILRKQTLEEKKMVTRAQTFASLHHRLSMERDGGVEVQTVGKGDKVDSGNGESLISVPERLAGREERGRESTIKWDVPTPLAVTPRRTPEPEGSTPSTSVPELGKEEQRSKDKEPESPRRSLLRRLSLKRATEKGDGMSPV
jgi:Mg2+ and Co2+ transporter CorA